MKLRDFLRKQNSLIGFIETQLGHDSILNPNGADDSSNAELYTSDHIDMAILRYLEWGVYK